MAGTAPHGTAGTFATDPTPTLALLPPCRDVRLILTSSCILHNSLWDTSVV
jgi:hypothetical protein